MSNSRVWVYQAERKLSESEALVVKEVMDKFMGQWAAHGERLNSTYDLLHNLILVLKVDQSSGGTASGCSIDSSVSVILQLEKELNVNFLDRNNFAFEKNGEVIPSRLKNLEEHLLSGDINDNTIVYNGLVSNLEEYQSNFRVPFKDSWQKKMVKSSRIV